MASSCPSLTIENESLRAIFIDMAKRADTFAIQLAPRGLNRTEAAYYIGVSPSLFDQLVKDRRMPSPLKINTRRIWDRQLLDMAFEELDREQETDSNPWDE